MGYNNVFGYYLEVRNTYKDQVPQEWIRKQTLANAERYITEELKQYEQKIMGADEQILVLETRLFTELVTDMQAYIPQIQADANIVARLGICSRSQRLPRSTATCARWLRTTTCSRYAPDATPSSRRSCRLARSTCPTTSNSTPSSSR